jgi:hypothetical protein
MTIFTVGIALPVCVFVCARAPAQGRTCMYVRVCMSMQARSGRTSARVHACIARITCSVEQEKEKKLRNLRQTVRSSMRRAHVKTGMLKKRALYWQMLE